MFSAVIFITLCLVTFISTATVDDWKFSFNNSTEDEIEIGNSFQLTFNTTTDTLWSNENLKIEVIISDEEVAFPNPRYFNLPSSNDKTNTWSNTFNVTTEFLGYTKIYFQVVKIINDTVISVKNSSDEYLNIKVMRKQQPIDKIFVICVAGLMSIIFINLGCALDVKQLQHCVKKPIAPAASFFSQFLILPILSFFYAKLLFPNSISMQLGLFFTGISPGGGASSVWAVLLGGNINLSIVLTTIGTLQAFVMIPFWIVFLGQYIFSIAKLPVPYTRIGSSIVALIIPLCIGYYIQRFLPRVSAIMIRILKPLSSCLIIFIIIFATVTNLYLFKIFSWKIFLAGALIPWTGFLIGCLTATFARLPLPDIISMTIESGIQNTGIAIFMLKFSLGQPAADITTVIPVAVALMTPVPLLIGFILKKYLGKKENTLQNQDPAAESMINDNNAHRQPTKVTIMPSELMDENKES